MKEDFREFEGYVFRIHYKEYSPLSIEGSKKSGGRWNRKNRYGALYTSLDKEALKAEFKKMVRRRGLKVEDLFNLSITKIKVKLKKVLDLTSSEIREKFKIDLSDITSDNRKAVEKCCKVADKARELGFEAILSPSSADPKGKNLNIFTDKLLENSYIKQIKTESLIRI